MRMMMRLYSEEHSLSSYTVIQEAKEILSCQIWGNYMSILRDIYTSTTKGSCDESDDNRRIWKS